LQSYLSRSTKVELRSEVLHRKVELRSEVLHQKVELRSEALHRKVELKSEALHRKVELRSEALRRKLELKSEALKPHHRRHAIEARNSLCRLSEHRQQAAKRERQALDRWALIALSTKGVPLVMGRLAVDMLG
jgi:hypothetical protein